MYSTDAKSCSRMLKSDSHGMITIEVIIIYEAVAIGQATASGMT